MTHFFILMWKYHFSKSNKPNITTIIHSWTKSTCKKQKQKVRIESTKNIHIIESIQSSKAYLHVSLSTTVLGLPHFPFCYFS